MEKQTLINLISESKARSAWDESVKIYAIETVEEWEDERFKEIDLIEKSYLACYIKKLFLNGALDFYELSSGGSYLIYDEDIAERTCSPSEFKRAHRKNGYLKEFPNKNETWLDLQSRALYHAYKLIVSIVKDL